MRGGGLNMSTYVAAPADPVYFMSDFESSTASNSKTKAISTTATSTFHSHYTKYVNKIVKPPKVVVQENCTTTNSVRASTSESKSSTDPENSISAPIYEQEPIPLLAYLSSVFFIFCLGIVALLNELLGIRVRKEVGREGYISLYNWFDTFYQNHLIRRVWSAMFTPICSSPGPIMSVLERESANQGWDITYTTRTKDCFNLGSYNYLNLGSSESPCVSGAIDILKQYGVGHCTNRCEIGSTNIHHKLERAVADFIGVEDALTFGMGFATNSLNIPALMNSQTLVLSDQFNHSSIILGIKMSRAKIVVFAHNDMRDLEMKIRNEIIKASLAGKPWKKVFIIVEGVYSMHGSMAKLREIIQIKEKYGAYLYLDEAHCMGAIGTNGKGVTQYFNIDPTKVDVLMGTFAKSFGAIGGYIAGSKKLIGLLRRCSNAHYYGTCMPSVIAGFIIEGLKFLSEGVEGPARVKNLMRAVQFCWDDFITKEANVGRLYV